MPKLGKLENNWKPLAAYSLFFALFFSPIWAAGRLIAPEDEISQNIASVVCHRSLWTPLILGGFPTHAEPQFMTFYPFSLICLLPGGWNFFIIIPFVVAAFAIYLLAKDLTDSAKGAAVAGIVYTTSAFYMSETPHIHVVHALMWLPIIMLTQKKLHETSKSVWFAAYTAATAFCVLAGHPQSFVYCLSLCAAFALYLVFLDKNNMPNQTLRMKALNLAKLGAPIALGIGASSIQYYPTMDLVQMSNRLRMTKEIFNSFRVYPVCLPVYMFYPWLFGGPGGNVYGVNNWGPPGIRFPYAYIGILPIVLVCIANYAKPLRRPVLFWSLCAVASILFSLGTATPFGQLLQALPVYQQFRAPYKHLIGLITCASILSAFGVKAIQEKHVGTKQLWFSVILVCGLMLFSIYCICAGGMDLTKLANQAGNSIVGFAPWQTAITLVPWICFLLGLASIFTFFFRKDSMSAFLFLLISLVVDLGSYSWFTIWRTESYLPSILECPPELKPYRDELLKSNTRLLPPRGRAGNYLEAPPNLSWNYGMPSITGHTALITGRIHDLFSIEEGGFVERRNAREFGSAMNISCVKYLFLPKPIFSEEFSKFCSGNDNADKWKQVGDLGNVTVQENLKVFPHYWFTGEAKVLQPPEILKTILDNKLPDGTAFDAHKTALVEEQLPTPIVPSDSPGTIKLNSQTDTSLDLQVSTATPQLLVLSDSWYPGWEAQLDDQPAKILRTNYIFRGIVIPSGQHHLALAYKPARLLIGFLLTLVSIALTIASCLFLNHLNKRRNAAG